MNRVLAFLNIEFLLKEDAFKNWRMIFFLAFLALVMINSGHQTDRKIFRISELNRELQVLKSQYVERKARLLGLRKETRINALLKERGFQVQQSTPYTLSYSKADE